MSTEENKRVVKKFQDLLAQQAFDEAFALLAPGATWWVPTDKPGGMLIPKDTMQQMVGSFLKIFVQSPVFEVQSMTAEEDRVCVQQTGRNGRTRGGAAYDNDYHMLFRLRDGLIIEVREYMNPLLVGAVTAELQGAK